MMLSVNVRQRLGAFLLDAAFESAGRLTALFGPSGSGKTSLVNLIGGLIPAQDARIAVDGRVLVDSRQGIVLPKHRRRIGYVFQDARLFPHLTVSQNLRYGRFFAPARERYADMESVVELLGISSLLDRKPDLLSGGEKSRVAIGRALIASPRLLLMDEPLASLDELRKGEILPYIERLRDEAGIPIVYVSHSVAEVARLANHIVLMAGGKVTASGTAAEILQKLDLLPEEERGEGGSILDMTVSATDETFGMSVLRSPAGEIRVPRFPAALGTTVRVRIRARDVIIATERPRGLSALNILSGKITSISSSDGPVADIFIDCHGQSIVARITRQSTHALDLKPGQDVFAVIKTVSFNQANTTPGIAKTREAPT